MYTIDELIKVANDYYKKHGRDAIFEEFENLIVEEGNPYHDILFAKGVKGADVSKFEKVVVESRSFKYINEFARQVKGCSYQNNSTFGMRFEPKNPEDVRYKHIFEDEDMESYDLYYSNDFLYAYQDKKNGVVFDVDEATFDYIDRQIKNNETMNYWTIYYAVLADNFDLVKKIADYGNYDYLIDKPFDITKDTYYHPLGLSATQFIYSSLVYEATAVSDVRILKLLIEKGCKLNDKNSIKNAIVYGSLENVKYMYEELGQPIVNSRGAVMDNPIEMWRFKPLSDLAFAYVMGKNDIVEYLLSKGANPHFEVGIISLSDDERKKFGFEQLPEGKSVLNTRFDGATTVFEMAKRVNDEKTLGLIEKYSDIFSCANLIKKDEKEVKLNEYELNRKVASCGIEKLSDQEFCQHVYNQLNCLCRNQTFPKLLRDVSKVKDEKVQAKMVEEIYSTIAWDIADYFDDAPSDAEYIVRHCSDYFSTIKKNLDTERLIKEFAIGNNKAYVRRLEAVFNGLDRKSKRKQGKTKAPKYEKSKPDGKPF